MNSDNPVDDVVMFEAEEQDDKVPELASTQPIKFGFVDNDVTQQSKVDFTEACTPEQARRLIELGGLKRAVIPYRRKQGSMKARHGACTGPSRWFPTYLEALWNTEGSLPEFQAPVKMQELQIWDGNRRELMVFHGAMAIDRLYALRPSICGSKTKECVADYSCERNLVIRLSLASWCRSAAGRSDIKDLNEWASRCRDVERTVGGALKPDLRTQRFWKGIGDIHLFLTLLCRSSKDFKGLRRSALTEILESGLFENSFLEQVKEGINSLMNVDSDHAITSLIRTKGEEIQAQYYKLRKVIPKDDSYPMTNCLKAQSRFCSTEEHVKTSVGQRGIEIFQNEFKRFIDLQDEETLRRWARPSILHQGGAGLWFTRKNGGRPDELQMIVGLHRLSRGQKSPMCENFGTLTEGDGVEELLTLLRGVDMIYDEIVDACSWFLEEFVYKRQIPRLFYCIYPEREVKSRTFMLYDYASQLGGNMAKCSLVAFLKQTKFCEEAYKGIRGHSNAHDLIKRAVARELYVLSADASTSTDNLDFAECKAVFEPALSCMHPFARQTVERVFSPTMTACTVTRPKFSPVWFFANDCKLFEYTGLKLNRDVVEKDDWERPSHDSGTKYLVDDVPDVRLKPHAKLIVDCIEKHKRVLLKSPTGSGKTVFAASVTPSIIQFTSILNLEAFAETLKFYEIDHAVHYSTSRTKKLTGNVTILTTGFYVIQLARRFPKMLVVLDEAETLRQEFLLNIIDSKKIRNHVLLMSATPEQIAHHDAFLLEIEAHSPWKTDYIDLNESEMLKEVESSGRKTLICVHSEPFAKSLGGKLPDSFVLDSSSRFEGYMTKVREARVIISTNVVRSSLTIPDLDDVVDYGIQYEELDFPSLGISNLVITDVDEFQRKQLAGRVGRMRDGRYISVKSSIVSVGSVSPPSLKMPTVSNRLGSIDWDIFPRAVSLAPIVVETYSQRFLERVFDMRFSNHTPHSLQIVKKQMNRGGFFIAQLLLFEESGIPTRISSLRLSDEIEDRELANLFKESVNGDYIREIEDVIKSCRDRPEFRQPLTLMSRWLETLGKESIIAKGLGSETAEVLLAFRCWRTVVRTQGPLYVSQFRNFQVPKKKGDPEFAVLIGATRFGGVSRYLVAVPVSEKIFNLLAGEMQKETEVRIVSSGELNLDEIESLVIGRESADETGRQKKNVVVGYERFETSRTFRPEQLDSCLLTLEKLASGTSTKLTTRGCPQSHVLSFPTLNALNYCAYLGTRELYPEFDALGYGDDGLAAGVREACETFLRARESYGLLTNRGSTGISKGGREGLAVFCEMIFSLKTGKEIISAKPKSTNYAYRAYHQHDCFSSTPHYQNDIGNIVEGLRNKVPSMFSVIMKEADASCDLLPYRSTITRQILTRMSYHDATLSSVVTTRQALEIIEFLEPFVLLVSPSSKGAPVRESRRASRTPFVTLEFYNRIREFLIGHENYAESTFRSLPFFSQDGTVGSILRQDEGQVLNVETAEKLLTSLR